MSDTVTNIKINLSKIPKDKIFDGKNGKYIDVTIAERQSPDQFGNTHTMYHYDSATKVKTYIGEGKLFTFGQQQSAQPQQKQQQTQPPEKDFSDLPW